MTEEPTLAVRVGGDEALAVDAEGALFAAVTLMRERTERRSHGYCCASFYEYESGDFLGAVDGSELARLSRVHLQVGGA